MLLRGDVIAAAAQDARLREEAAWPIRAVIVTPFAPAAGVAALSEAQSWIARERLVDELAFPAGAHPLRINAERTVLAMVFRHDAGERCRIADGAGARCAV